MKSSCVIVDGMFYTKSLIVDVLLWTLIAEPLLDNAGADVILEEIVEETYYWMDILYTIYNKNDFNNLSF